LLLSEIYTSIPSKKQIGSMNFKKRAIFNTKYTQFDGWKTKNSRRLNERKEVFKRD